MKRVERTVADALAHQDVPFEKLVEDLQPERRLNQNPLFQVSFQLLPLPKSLNVAERVWIDHQTAALDLAVELIDSPEGITIRVDYASSLFHASSIRRLIAQYVTLLRAIVANPERRISELELMSGQERQSLINEWSRSSAPLPGHLPPAHQLIVDQTRRTPDAIAIDHGAARHTYAQLEDAAGRVARQLRTRGVQRGDRVAVAVPPSFDLYACLLGVMKAGAAYLPIDVAQNERRTDSILLDAHPAAILTVEGAAARFAAHECVILADARFEHGDMAEVPLANDDAAYVIFTSGSTGRPKGVVVEHGSLANQLRWMQETFPLTAADGVLQKYPVAFDAAIVEIFSTLAAGARLVPVDREALVDSGRLATIMREQGVTVLDGVPSLLTMLLDEGIPLRGLRRIIAGGEVLPPDLLVRLRASGAREIVNMYGPTEATITATAWIDDGRTDIVRVPIGQPIRNMVAYVLDDRMQPVPVGVPGELYLGGAGIARQYLGSPELTAAAFVASPFEDPAAPRLYRTGDLVRFLPDRNLEYLGRTDRQMKVRGYRVAPEEIEAALREHPAITDCAVVHEPDAGGSGLSACVVTSRSLPELWPSVGEYGVYDDLLYHAMTSDAPRNRAYQSAIDRWVPGKAVLDIGTGADLLWARACIEAGARHVWAVEVLPDAAARATATASALGLADRISVIQSDSRALDLPEPVDVIVSELIGTIASSEGAVPTLNDARRLLAPNGIMIPLRSATRIAAVELPRALAEYPTFTAVSGHFAHRIFDEVGGPMDLRLCVKGLSRHDLLSDDAVFEDLDFAGEIALDGRTSFELTVHREGHLHGFLLWIQLTPGGDYNIDTIDGTYSWLPVFVPLDDMPVRARAGDRIHGSAEVSYPGGQRYPDYRIAGRICRAGFEDTAFDLDLPYAGHRFRHQPLYRELFHPDGRARSDGVASAPALRAWLSPRLPAHMIPDAFTVMPALPRTASGKLDAAAMAAAPRSRPFVYVAPRSDVERLTAEVWQRVLKLDRVGIHDNFFDVGGHSLLLVRLLRELRLAISPDVSLTDLFQFSTISGFADALHRRRAECVVSG
jgi:amino acid adenylation domain-containing protein